MVTSPLKYDLPMYKNCPPTNQTPTKSSRLYTRKYNKAQNQRKHSKTKPVNRPPKEQKNKTRFTPNSTDPTSTTGTAGQQQRSYCSGTSSEEQHHGTASWVKHNKQRPCSTATLPDAASKTATTKARTNKREHRSSPKDFPANERSPLELKNGLTEPQKTPNNKNLQSPALTKSHLMQKSD
ncbi:hypothetical protein Ancab_031653 [Ancistrocladus abbreviatus]